MPTANTPDRAPAGIGIIGRARTAARAYRDTAPAEYASRHGNWRSRQHRAILARALASTLGVPVDHVSLRDDHNRRYRALNTPHEMPGDLAEVTDPATGACLYLIPDHPGATDCWLLLDECAHCTAPLVPVARIASLIDLGAYLDFDHELGVAGAPVHFHGDPAHRDDCDFHPRNGT